MNYKLRNARHRRPPAPGMDVLEKRTCSKWPGGHRVRSGKWTLQMHARTPPAPNITLAAPRRGMGSRKASGALSPRGWLRWVTLCALLRKPPRRPPPPTTSPARLQGRTVDSAEGLGWSKEVRGVGGGLRTHLKAHGVSGRGVPFVERGLSAGTQCMGLVECWARSPAAGSQLSSL